MNKVFQWWWNLNFENKFYKAIEWSKSKGYDSTEYHPDRLTDEQLLEVYNYHKQKD